MIDAGRRGGMSFVFELLGRTACVSDEWKEPIESEPVRDRPLDDCGGVLESMDELLR